MSDTMTARILDGKATALAVREDVAARAKRLTDAGVQPGLTVVLVGDDPAVDPDLQRVACRVPDERGRVVGAVDRAEHDLGAIPELQLHAAVDDRRAVAGFAARTVEVEERVPFVRCDLGAGLGTAPTEGVHRSSCGQCCGRPKHVSIRS